MTPAARRLQAALAAVLVQAEAPELALVHRWLDNWHGVGCWRWGSTAATTSTSGSTVTATGGRCFWVTGFAHSILGGSAWEPTVWRAVQRAGWNAIHHAERNL